jgi:hypothetical protein
VTLSAECRFDNLLSGALFQRQAPSVLVSLPALRLALADSGTGKGLPIASVSIRTRIEDE